MREFAKIRPDFWTSGAGRQLKESGPESVIVALYLLTSPLSNMLGIYYLPVVLISHETGLSMEKVKEGLQRACVGGFCKYDAASEVVLIPAMAGEQVGAVLHPKDNLVAAVHKAYKSLPNCPFIEEFYHKYKEPFHLPEPKGSVSRLEALLNKEKEKEKEKENIKLISGGSTRQGTSPPAASSKTNNIPYKQIISFLNGQAGTAFKDTTQATRSKIKARFKEGFVLDDFESVISYIISEWESDDKMNKFIRPETIFSTKFEGYLQAAQKGTTPGKGQRGKWKPNELININDNEESNGKKWAL